MFGEQAVLAVLAVQVALAVQVGRVVLVVLAVLAVLMGPDEQEAGRAMKEGLGV